MTRYLALKSVEVVQLYAYYQSSISKSRAEVGGWAKGRLHRSSMDCNAEMRGSRQSTTWETHSIEKLPQWREYWGSNTEQTKSTVADATGDFLVTQGHHIFVYLFRPAPPSRLDFLGR